MRALLLACLPVGIGPSDLTLYPFEIAGVEGLVEVGTLVVPEDHDRPDGRKIELSILVLRARSPEPLSDPLFVIQGGPGQAVGGLAGFYGQIFDAVREERDLVLVDQRGTGDSNGLAAVVTAKTLLVDLDEAIPAAWVAPTLERCAQTADLDCYGTQSAVRDLDLVREALGAEQVNLYGTSYGTRCALVYARLFPERVRCMALKGVAPMQLVIGLDYARDAQTALDGLFDACERDPAWASNEPPVRRLFSDVLARLDREPARLEVENPISHSEEEVVITRAAFAHAVRTLLYAPSTQSRLPLLIAEAYAGRFDGVADVLVRARLLYAKQMYLGMSLSVLAAEDAPRLTEEAIERSSEGTFLGDVWVRGLARLAADWPATPVSASFHRPVRSSVPTLLISGGLDPATPPRWAERAAATLSRAKHLVVPEAGHSFAGLEGCVDRILSDFIRAGSAAGLDRACVDDIRRPPFAAPPERD